MNESPLVSVIVPTFNRCNLVTRAVASILGQSFASLEVIVVDDGSTDDTIEVVKACQAEDDRVVLLSNTLEKGCGGARNTGIARARGEYIAFLDDDDQYHRDKIATQYEISAANPDIDVLVSGVSKEWCDSQSELGWVRAEFYPNRFFDGCFLMCRRAALEGLRLRCNYMEWRDLGFQFYEHGRSVFLSPERLVTKNPTTGSLSRQREKMALSALANAKQYFERSRNRPEHSVFRHYLASCYKDVANLSLKRGHLIRAAAHYRNSFLAERKLKNLVPFVTIEPRLTESV